jgi:hypothetical protein
MRLYPVTGQAKKKGAGDAEEQLNYYIKNNMAGMDVGGR